MSVTEYCLIQIDGGDGLFFISPYGGYTENIQEARIFNNELDAQIYVDKHGLRQLARVSKIVSKAD